MKIRLLLITLLFSLFAESHAVTLSEAKALAQAENYPEALAAFRNLIQQPKMAKNAEVNKFYGQCLCMTGSYEESLSYLTVGNKGGFYGALWYLGISKQHLYDFEGAIEDLEQYKKRCKKNSPWIPRTDSIIAECQLGMRALSHIQDVVIIDSMMVSKQNFFEYYKLGHESGEIAADETFEASYYDRERITEESIVSLMEDAEVKYPFMRSDGETFYFASNATPGFGGYDIYRTSFNSDNDSFFAPTRLGMPFNSPYNDYLMAVDETNQVGWWATDRNAAPGYVCIYLFILDDDAEQLDDEDIARARIDRIKDSWKEDDYDDLLHAVRNVDVIIEDNRKVIPISDFVVYSSIDDFKNPEARKAYEKYEQIQETIAATKAELASARLDYSAASSGQRNQMRPQILQKEVYMQSLYRQLKEARKQYCYLENK